MDQQDDSKPPARVGLTFEDFYAVMHPRAVSLAYALTGNRWAAEELAHDSFVSALRNWDRIGNYEAPEAWLRRVLFNRTVSRSRRLASEARALVRLTARRSEPLEGIPARDDDLWAIIRELPPRQAQVVALHYLEDVPIAAVAKELGISEGAVKHALHAARSRVRDRALSDPVLRDLLGLAEPSNAKEVLP